MALVSIVIPTRNRQKCAESLVRSVLTRIEDCQVVVSDNSDDESLRALLNDVIEDQRLIYQYLPGTLSVVENFTLALNLANGTYVSFLGDDDIIGPGFVDIVNWAKKKMIDAVLCNIKGRALYYIWPGIKHKYWGDVGGKLFFSNFSGNIRKVDVKASMREALLHLGTGPRCMPRLYLGLISQKLITEAKNRYGSLFGGYSPDVYSSHLLASICNNAVSVDFPFIIPGVSPKSTSAARTERTDVGGLTCNDHVGRFKEVIWDHRIPRYYSPFTVWAQSLTDALSTTGPSIPLKAFIYLYATCLVFTPKNYKNVFYAIKTHGNVFKFWWLLIITLMVCISVSSNYILKKIIVIARRRPDGARYEESNLPDTMAALDRLTGFLEKKNITINFGKAESL